MQVQLQTQQHAAAQVHKFGGSSLATAARFSAVADIVAAHHPQSLWVVVSAPGDTTDSLLQIIACAADGHARDSALNTLQRQLRQLVEQTLVDAAANTVIAQLQHWLAAVPDWLAQQQPNEVLAIGERFSALLLTEILKQRQLKAVALDARDFICLTQHHPEYDRSAQLLSELTQAEHIHVVTGYIARDEKGRSITLGRNGSDYSATLLGALVNAAEVTI